MGPVYMLYDDIFYCQEDYQLADFDPYINSQVAEDYKMFASYANNPDMMANEAIMDYEIEEDIVLHEVMQNETLQNDEIIVTE
jgi:hypothetical protein